MAFTLLILVAKQGHLKTIDKFDTLYNKSSILLR